MYKIKTGCSLRIRSYLPRVIPVTVSRKIAVVVAVLFRTANMSQLQAKRKFVNLKKAAPTNQ
jgi:hypothetical protein